MKCEYCSGNMSLEDERCPHCGQLNKHAQQHIKDMKHYKGEFEQTREGVYKSTKGYTQVTVRIIIIAVLVIVMVLLGVLRYNAWSFRRMLMTSDAKRNVKEYSATLDRYMEEENFRALMLFEREHNLSYLSEGYEQYQPVLRAVDNYGTVCDYIMRLTTPTEYTDINQQIEYLNESLEYFYSSCNLEKYSHIENVDREENVEALNRMKQNIAMLLQTYCYLTEEDLEGFEELSKAKRGTLIEERMEANE